MRERDGRDREWDKRKNNGTNQHKCNTKESGGFGSKTHYYEEGVRLSPAPSQDNRIRGSTQHKCRTNDSDGFYSKDANGGEDIRKIIRREIHTQKRLIFEQNNQV